MAERIAIVLFSGGIDSSSCIHFLKKQKYKIHALHLSHGQKAETQELKASKKVAAKLKVKLKSVKLSGYKQGLSAEIPGRNLLLVALAFLNSGSEKGVIAMGLHKGSPYLDCSREFIEETTKLIEFLSQGRLQFEVPFATWSKAEIIKYAQQNKIPLPLTYSCEKGGKKICGKCLSCLDRKELGC